MCFFNLFGQKETPLPDIYPLKDEPSIDLRRNVLKKIWGKFEIRRADKFIEIKDSKNDSLTRFVEVQKLHLIDLYKKSFNCNFEKHWITGLKIHYIINENLDFEILFQPVIMNAIEKLSHNGRICLFEELPQKFPYYKYNSTAESPFSEIDGEGFKKKYRDNVLIQHSSMKEDIVMPFIKRIDSEFAVFSFQEIFSFICRNDIDSIFLYSTAIKNRHDPYSEIRHSIVISYKRFNERKWAFLQKYFAPQSFLEGPYNTRRGFRKRMANLAHLCPPHRDFVFILMSDINIDPLNNESNSAKSYFKKNKIEKIAAKHIYKDWGDTRPVSEITRLNSKKERVDAEDTIDLSRTGVRVYDAERDVVICNKYIKLNNDEIASIVPDKIGNMDGEEASIQFNTIRNTLIQGQEQKFKTLPENYVTAVKIHYGVESISDTSAGKEIFKLILVYEPVLMESLGQVGENNDLYEYEERELTEKKFYICDLIGKFASISEDKATAYQNLYKDKLTFRHFSDRNNHTKYIVDLDTEYALISFHEFFNFIWKNSPKANPVSIYSAISCWEHSPGVETRHGILISPNEGLKVDIYGNLAHLCPPHRDIYYRLESKP